MRDELSAWTKKHIELVQTGRVGPRDAGEKIKLAQRNLARAQGNLVAADNDEALAKAENAIVNAADAVLAHAGYRLRGKTGSHQARFEFPGLPREFREVRARLDRIRSLRTTVTYDAVDVVDASEAKDVVQLAERLVALARKKLAP
ncbi:MAG TPA: HEPN domain-containing protein [Candidatus Limnocylindria bacterium]|nr:HEPN domain-containing protein [Candidatus Limnocylindria bacterium]